MAVLLPFDRVEVAARNGHKILTVEQFLAAPLHERVTWLLERRLSFFLKDSPVDSRLALRALQARGKAG